MCEIQVSFTKILHVNYVFHTLKHAYFICEIKTSYVKMFQLHMFFTCEMTFEIFVSVHSLAMSRQTDTPKDFVHH